MTHINSLMNYLDASVTAYHAVLNAESMLLAKGYERLEETGSWVLQPQGKYYVVRGESALIAWQMGPSDTVGVRLIGAHTDSPGLHVKPNAVYTQSGYVQLGVEVYGGPLLGTWTDRDLSLAGRVIIEEGGRLAVKPYRSDKVLLRVPQLAIHLNRKVNDEGLVLNKQQHLPPVLALHGVDDVVLTNDLLRQVLADDLDLPPEKIKNWKLECFDTQGAALSGLNSELLVSGRIDNLTMCHAALTALESQAGAVPQTAMIALFDNEEIGSSTSNGAASGFVRDIITRVGSITGAPDDVQRSLARSFCISVDGAHAVHPNYAEYHDSQHAVKMNQGPVIKMNANHRYASDAMTSAIFEQLGRDVEVPVQKYIHRTDLPCGSTIGPITATGLGIPVVDVGNAMLSMHSIRETCGVDDHGMMIQVLSHFFQKPDLHKV